MLADIRQAKLASLAATNGLEARVIGFESWDEVAAVPSALPGAVSQPSTGATDRALQRLADACRSEEG